MDEEGNQKSLTDFLNPYCTDKCVNNLIDGKLQCDCADSATCNWKWEKQPDTCATLSQDDREVMFHPVYSSGTAALRGNAPFTNNQHHFWEMKMMSNLYGTDVMIGVGTGDMVLTNWRYRFFSLLGCDNKSWGYSYNGQIQHDNIMMSYGPKFGLGSLIGVHLDMYSGTLEYYLNRKPLGVAFRGLKGHTLYPMICSTAAQSAMKMTCATSFNSSLQLISLQSITKHPELYSQFRSTPGIARIYENNFFWMLPKECEDAKRKLKSSQKSLKRRKTIQAPTRFNPLSGQLESKCLIKLTIDSDSDSSCDTNYDY